MQMLLDAALSPLPDDIELALHDDRIVLSTANKALNNERLFSPGLGAEHGRIGGNLPPSEEMQAFLADNLFEHRAALYGKSLIPWRKQHADAVFAGRGQFQAQSTAFALQKIVRNLDQDARTIAGLFVAAGRAAMQQVLQ